MDELPATKLQSLFWCWHCISDPRENYSCRFPSRIDKCVDLNIFKMGDVSTAGGVQLLILASCVTLQQNRRQKLFNRGALRYKNSTDI